MPNHHLLSLVSALSSSASTSLCFFDDAFEDSSGDFDNGTGVYALVDTVEKEQKGCECMELCFCARLDVLNERAMGLLEEGRRCLGL